jgi:Domain of unknown function (DUF4189)
MHRKAFVATLAAGLVMASGSAFGWGAITQSNDGYYGLAVGAPDRRVAEEQALRFCGHPGCGVRQVFQGQCAAIAIGVNDPRRWWYFIRSEKEEFVRRAAFNECRNGLGGQPCRVLVSGCD